MANLHHLLAETVHGCDKKYFLISIIIIVNVIIIIIIIGNHCQAGKTFLALSMHS
jgi:hypothetical protein